MSFSQIVKAGSKADMIIATGLVIAILFLVVLSSVKHDTHYAVSAIPLAMVTVGLMVSVAISLLAK